MILFVDGMLITYQLDEFTYDCFISIMESSWCQAVVVEAICIDQCTVLRLHSMGNASRSSSEQQHHHQMLLSPTSSDDEYVALRAQHNKTIPARAIVAKLNTTDGPLV